MDVASVSQFYYRIQRPRVLRPFVTPGITYTIHFQILLSSYRDFMLQGKMSMLYDGRKGSQVKQEMRIKNVYRPKGIGISTSLCCLKQRPAFLSIFYRLVCTLFYLDIPSGSMYMPPKGLLHGTVGNAATSNETSLFDGLAHRLRF